MDQYASKVIEKCLKIGGNEFLDRYLERVCEGRQDRPRMPLIDSKSVILSVNPPLIPPQSLVISSGTILSSIS